MKRVLVFALTVLMSSAPCRGADPFFQVAQTTTTAFQGQPRYSLQSQYFPDAVVSRLGNATLPETNAEVAHFRVSSFLDATSYDITLSGVPAGRSVPPCVSTASTNLCSFAIVSSSLFLPLRVSATSFELARFSTSGVYILSHAPTCTSQWVLSDLNDEVGNILFMRCGSLAWALPVAQSPASPFIQVGVSGVLYSVTPFHSAASGLTFAVVSQLATRYLRAFSVTSTAATLVWTLDITASGAGASTQPPVNRGVFDAAHVFGYVSVPTTTTPVLIRFTNSVATPSFSAAGGIPVSSLGAGPVANANDRNLIGVGTAWVFYHTVENGFEHTALVSSGTLLHAASVQTSCISLSSIGQGAVPSTATDAANDEIFCVANPALATATRTIMRLVTTPTPAVLPIFNTTAPPHAPLDATPSLFYQAASAKLLIVTHSQNTVLQRGVACVGAWATTGTCSVRCATSTGSVEQTYSITQPASGGGAQCDYSHLDTRTVPCSGTDNCGLHCDMYMSNGECATCPTPTHLGVDANGNCFACLGNAVSVLPSTSTSPPGIPQCDRCAAGYGYAASVTLNYYGNPYAACTLCGAGSYSDGLTACATCPAQTYAPAAGSTVCTASSPSAGCMQYSTTVNACVACGAGHSLVGPVCVANAPLLSPTPSAVCGNFVVESGETCDDGSTANGDGCSSDCQVEPGWSCVGVPTSVCYRCGNGRVDTQTGEVCDDGNNADFDGCSATCQVEEQWQCGGEPSFCKSCGNGIVETAPPTIIGFDEECDPGGFSPPVPSSGCSITCTVLPGYTCAGAPSVCTPTPPPPSPTPGSLCGNNVVDHPEQCDDATLSCNQASCECAAGYSSLFSLSGPACVSNCGNGVIDGTEACDDGNLVDGDGCSSTCQLEPANCVGSFGPFGPCSVSCGGGTHTHTFQITTQQAAGGTQCDYTDGYQESLPCNTQACPVAVGCQYAHCSTTPCSVSCGTGSTTTTCTLSTVLLHGEHCSPTSATPPLPVIAACTPHPCPADCVGAFTSGPCVGSCGTGVRNETWHITTPAVGDGACPYPAGHTVSFPCPLGPCPVPCVYTQTSVLGACSALSGTRTNTTTITVTSPAQHGGFCPHDTIGTVPCAVDCVVSAFGAWSACSHTCGGGSQTRTRTVIVAPLNGGAACPVLTEYRACNTQLCCDSVNPPKPGKIWICHGTAPAKNAYNLIQIAAAAANSHLVNGHGYANHPDILPGSAGYSCLCTPLVQPPELSAHSPAHASSEPHGSGSGESDSGSSLGSGSDEGSGSSDDAPSETAHHIEDDAGTQNSAENTVGGEGGSADEAPQGLYKLSQEAQVGILVGGATLVIFGTVLATVMVMKRKRRNSDLGSGDNMSGVALMPQHTDNI